MTAVLELRQVQKAFGSVVVADDLTFSIGEGETLGVVGPNGAGKTSMLNLITGILPVDGGQILYLDEDITRVPTHLRARAGIGRTHQVPRPFEGMTVLENVLIAARNGGRSRIAGDDPVTVSAEALDTVGLLDRANVPAGTLPLLDRKRLELARALACRPRLLLLDEVGGGLTEAEIHGLAELVRSFRASGIAVIWIEHVVQALLAGVDRLIAMDFGRMLADGPPHEVMADPRVHAVYMGQEMELVL